MALATGRNDSGAVSATSAAAASASGATDSGLAGDRDSVTLVAAGGVTLLSVASPTPTVEATLGCEVESVGAGTLLRGGVDCARGGAAAAGSFSATAGGRAVVDVVVLVDEAARALGGADRELVGPRAASSRTSGGGELSEVARGATLEAVGFVASVPLRVEDDELAFFALTGAMSLVFLVSITLEVDDWLALLSDGAAAAGLDLDALVVAGFFAAGFSPLSLRTASAIARVPERDVAVLGFFGGALAPLVVVAATAGVLAGGGTASSAQSESMSSVAGGIDVVAASATGSSPQPASRSSSEGATDCGGVLALRRAEASAMSVKVPASSAMASPK